MYSNLKFQRLDDELAARIRDWRVLQDYDEPTRIYLHSPDETVPGEFGPVYVVRYVNGQRKLVRHATAAELVLVRDQARKIAQAHVIGARNMEAACVSF